jgi:hypothetical protein
VPLRAAAHGAVMVLLRPEMLHLEARAEGTARALWREFYGPDQRVGVALTSGQHLVARVSSATHFEEGASLTITVRGTAIAFPPDL